MAGWCSLLAGGLGNPLGRSSIFVAQQLAPLKGEIQDEHVRPPAVTSALFYWDTAQP